jgi:hypothetical protein
MELQDRQSCQRSNAGCADIAQSEVRTLQQQACQLLQPRNMFNGCWGRVRSQALQLQLL